MPLYEMESNPMATFNLKLFLAQEPKDPSKYANTFFSPYSQHEEIRPPSCYITASVKLDEAPLADFFFFFKTNLQPIPAEEANLKQI